jgi:hypothetical protein
MTRWLFRPGLRRAGGASSHNGSLEDAALAPWDEIRAEPDAREWMKTELVAYPALQPN